MRTLPVTAGLAGAFLPLHQHADRYDVLLAPGNGSRTNRGLPHCSQQRDAIGSIGVLGSVAVPAPSASTTAVGSSSLRHVASRSSRKRFASKP